MRKIVNKVICVDFFYKNNYVNYNYIILNNKIMGILVNIN